MNYFVHTGAVDEGAQIGNGISTWHFSHIMATAVISNSCNIEQNVLSDAHACIGNGCKLQSNVIVYHYVTYGDHVFCGPNMVSTNVYNSRVNLKKIDVVDSALEYSGGTPDRNSTIASVDIIGRYAFFGAGTRIRVNVSNYAMAYDNLAKEHAWICCCGVKLNHELVCSACLASYRHTPERLTPIEQPCA